MPSKSVLWNDDWLEKLDPNEDKILLVKSDGEGKALYKWCSGKIFYMWRDEHGIVEMLFTYIGNYQAFTGWKSWRSILIEILSSHEEIRQQRFDAAIKDNHRGRGEDVAIAEKQRTREDCEAAALRLMVSMSGIANECTWTPAVTDYHASNEAPDQPVFPGMTSRNPDWETADNVEKMPIWSCMPMKVETEEELLIPNSESLRPQIQAENDDEPLIVEDDTMQSGQFGGDQRESSAHSDYVPIPSISGLECTDPLQLPSVSGVAGQTVTSPRTKTVPLARRPGRRGRKQFQCSYCSKVCSTRIGRVVHERTHTGEKPFKCNFCPKTFSQLGNKAVHERIHTGEKPFVCSFCPKAFNQLGSKKVHERIHSGEKPYQCRICSQMFRYAGSKVAHERTHGVEALARMNASERIELRQPVLPPPVTDPPAVSIRTAANPIHKKVRKRETAKGPITCRYCHKVFRRNSEMKVHERIHTGYKPFTCAFCPKSFTRSSDRLNHERVHTGDKPYKCSFCGKTFVKSSDKSRHEQIHLGIKPYKCMYCGKTFCRSSDKARHERCHTGERPFKCRFCPKSFNRKAHMVDHERIHPQVPP